MADGGKLRSERPSFVSEISSHDVPFSGHYALAQIEPNVPMPKTAAGESRHDRLQIMCRGGTSLLRLGKPEYAPEPGQDYSEEHTFGLVPTVGILHSSDGSSFYSGMTVAVAPSFPPSDVSEEGKKECSRVAWTIKQRAQRGTAERFGEHRFWRLKVHQSEADGSIFEQWCWRLPSAEYADGLWRLCAAGSECSLEQSRSGHPQNSTLQCLAAHKRS